MTLLDPLWDFTALVTRERREKLLSVASFDEVIEQIVRGTVDSFKVKPRKNPPCEGCSRAFFRLLVGACVYDAFFNSPAGYRAQYCIGVRHGEEQNRRLIDAITPMCLEFMKGKEKSDFPTEMVLASLRGTDAKVWINDGDLPDVDETHINYQSWVAKAQASTKGRLADQAARANATVGILAPVGTHIEVKGAWLNSEGYEWRDPDKSRRAEEILNYGYT